MEINTPEATKVKYKGREFWVWRDQWNVYFGERNLKVIRSVYQYQPGLVSRYVENDDLSFAINGDTPSSDSCAFNIINPNCRGSKKRIFAVWLDYYLKDLVFERPTLAYLTARDGHLPSLSAALKANRFKKIVETKSKHYGNYPVQMYLRNVA